MTKNNKVTIVTGYTPDGEPIRQEAMAPIIVSASRSTDIPAFHSKWLVDRLNAGWCIWYNPFNQKPIWVSFEHTRAFVFWTKNPGPMLPLLEEFDRRGLGYYFQYTLNDYEREGLEPNVPRLDERLATFRKLAERIGPERVIWRFDPIILGSMLTPRDILYRIWNIGNALKGYTRRLVFSFVDVDAYRKVQINLAKTQWFSAENVHTAEPTPEQIEELCEGLMKIKKSWHDEGWDIAMATCAEVADLEKWGIEHNRCIDDVLLRRLFPQDKELMQYLGVKQTEIKTQDTLPGLEGLLKQKTTVMTTNPRLKDKGQRKACGCISAKDIGMYNTCGHFCVYCYANTSEEAVRRCLNRKRCESLIER